MDRTRPLKYESPSEGGSSLDESATEVNVGQDYLDANGLSLQIAGATVTTADSTTYVSRPNATQMAFTDQASGTLTLEQLLTSAPGKPSSHASLLDIIHFLADGPGDGWSASNPICIDLYTGPLLATRTWYTDSTQAKKIVSQSWTYAGPLVASLKYLLYAADGSTVSRSALDTYTYNGPVAVQRTRVFGTS